MHEIRPGVYGPLLSHQNLASIHIKKIHIQLHSQSPVDWELPSWTNLKKCENLQNACKKVVLQNRVKLGYFEKNIYMYILNWIFVVLLFYRKYYIHINYILNTYKNRWSAAYQISQNI